MAAPDPVNLAAALSGLRPKDKQPNSARVLNAWIAQAERRLGSDGGRLGWLVASTITTAALQQAVDEMGEPLFLLKGGTLRQHRLPAAPEPPPTWTAWSAATSTHTLTSLTRCFKDLGAPVNCGVEKSRPSMCPTGWSNRDGSTLSCCWAV